MEEQRSGIQEYYNYVPKRVPSPQWVPNPQIDPQMKKNWIKNHKYTFGGFRSLANMAGKTKKSQIHQQRSDYGHLTQNGGRDGSSCSCTTTHLKYLVAL